jgi:hypothetical protein
LLPNGIGLIDGTLLPSRIPLICDDGVEYSGKKF